MKRSPSLTSLSIVPTQWHFDTDETLSVELIPEHFKRYFKKVRKAIHAIMPHVLLKRGINTILRLISSRTREEENSIRFTEALVRAFLTFVPQGRSGEEVDLPSFQTFYNETLKLAGRAGSASLEEMTRIFYSEVGAMAQEEGCSMNDVILDATALHLDRQFLQGDTLNSLNMVFKEISRQLLMTTSLSFYEEDESLSLQNYTRRFKMHCLTSLPHEQACAAFFRIATLDFDYLREVTPLLVSSDEEHDSLKAFMSSSLFKIKKTMIWKTLQIYDHLLCLLQPSRKEGHSSQKLSLRSLNQRLLSLFNEGGRKSYSLSSFRKSIAHSSLAHKIQPYMETSLLRYLSRFAAPIRYSLNYTIFIPLGKGVTFTWSTSKNMFALALSSSVKLAEEVTHRAVALKNRVSNYHIYFMLKPGETLSGVMRWVQNQLERQTESLHYRSLKRYKEQYKGLVQNVEETQMYREEEGIREKSKSV